MLTREWLRRLPPAAPARFAAAPPWSAASVDPDGWASEAIRPETAAKAAAALPRETAAALKAILIRFGSLPFEREPFESLAGAAGLPAGVAARELERLRAAGIVFTVRKTWGDRLHFVASDALAAWTAALLPADVRPLGGGRRAARPLQDYVEPFGLQLLQMLAELGKRGLGPSAEGGAGVPERTAAAAAARLSFGPDALRPYGERFAPDGPEPAPFRLGLAAALHLGLLAEDGGRLSWRGEALAAWLATDAAVRERELLAFVTDRLAACDGRFMHAGALMRSLEGGVWYPAAGIDAWFERHEPDAREHWRVWAGTLAAFGWMQTGVSADDEPVIRWLIDPMDGPETAADGPAGARIHFMPGAELAVPPDLDWRLRWELELLADKTRPGPMTGMRLSATSYARWKEHGRTAAEALELLQEAAGSPVPDDLARSIRDWEDSAGRMAFRELLLLVCDDKRIADRAAAEPSVAQRLGERIGDRHFLVDRRHAAELRRRLARAGIPARAGLAEAVGQAGPVYPAARAAGETRGVSSAGTVPEAPADAWTAKAAGLLSGLRLERYAPDLDFRLPAAETATGADGIAGPAPAESASGSGGRTRAERTEGTLPSGSGACADELARAAAGSARMRPASGVAGTPSPAKAASAAARAHAARATGLPAHWFGPPRPVHPSTRREMVKRAIEIGAAVRIVREGTGMDILPERLEETESGWRMLGRPAGSAADPAVRVALDGDSWSEMQLLLPEWIGERN
jgi:hypothetical protein